MGGTESGDNGGVQWAEVLAEARRGERFCESGIGDDLSEGDKHGLAGCTSEQLPILKEKSTFVRQTEYKTKRTFFFPKFLVL